MKKSERYILVRQQLETVDMEIRRIGSRLVALKKLYEKTYPLKRTHGGWALQLVTCSKKNCDECPHNLVWKRYYYVKIVDEKKKVARKKAGKDPSYQQIFDVHSRRDIFPWTYYSVSDTRKNYAVWAMADVAGYNTLLQKIRRRFVGGKRKGLKISVPKIKARWDYFNGRQEKTNFGLQRRSAEFRTFCKTLQKAKDRIMERRKKLISQRLSMLAQLKQMAASSKDFLKATDSAISELEQAGHKIRSERNRRKGKPHLG